MKFNNFLRRYTAVLLYTLKFIKVASSNPENSYSTTPNPNIFKSSETTLVNSKNSKNKKSKSFLYYTLNCCTLGGLNISDENSDDENNEDPNKNCSNH